VPLPTEKIVAGLDTLVATAAPSGGAAAAQAILTTDTFIKQRACEVALRGGTVRLGGIAKGAGMIMPNMATMLAFITTDAAIERQTLQRLLARANALSFNRITVDGDTSTNDMVLCFATGAAGAPPLAADSRAFRTFRRALDQVCLALAKMIARDGEGATKLAEVCVRGARSVREARRAAETVATSPLVKTTLFGEDINWGRIMAALGRSGARFDPDRVAIRVDRVPVVQNGVSLGPRAEAAANRRLRRREFALTVTLHAGRAEARLWTTDLSEAYVRINAGYRS
jgi:glutamate N-acetyltransferase/amino-acid N-acetyltransferase